MSGPGALPSTPRMPSASSVALWLAGTKSRPCAAVAARRLFFRTAVAADGDRALAVARPAGEHLIQALVGEALGDARVLPGDEERAVGDVGLDHGVEEFGRRDVGAAAERRPGCGVEGVVGEEIDHALEIGVGLADGGALEGLGDLGAAQLGEEVVDSAALRGGEGNGV